MALDKLPIGTTMLWSSPLSFRRLVWVFPIAYVLHVLEELPYFTAWAQRYANASFTLSDYLTIHLAGIAVSIIALSAIRYFPNRLAIFVFFTFVFTPAVFYNIFFHAGATVVFGVYCPGLLTAITIYPLVFFLVFRQAAREHLLTKRVALISLALAGLFHAADISHNVFKVW